MPSVRDNIRIHDKNVLVYDRIHREIFNEVEQRRLRDVLGDILVEFFAEASSVESLDFGSGTGNVTRHLIELGCQVTAADVSPKSLDFVRNRFGCGTVLLEGGITSNLPSENYDLICAYSVLHHIPDYLETLKEFGRICRPGGVVYIDHEASPRFWENYTETVAIRAKLTRGDWSKYFRLRNYLYKIVSLVEPRHTVEGDIHVWPDDHIEWRRIDNLMTSLGFEKFFSHDFFVYNSSYQLDLFNEVKDIYSDTRCAVYRKTA